MATPDDREMILPFRRSARGPLPRAKPRPMPDGPPVAGSIRPAPERPVRPVAPSTQPTPPDAPTPRKRPSARPVAPAHPRPEPRDLTRLRMALNDLLAEDAILSDLCHDACAVADGIRAEWKRLPRSARPELRKRLKIADAEVVRLGELVGDLDERLDAARDAIERAERGK